MIANIGIIMTLSGLFFVLAMALTLASVSSAILLIFKKVKKHDRIPFVPFWAVGTAASVFFFR
jgi:prepilin signal peptidase PulO-like enzyme (type II secretory pathway)